LSGKEGIVGGKFEGGAGPRLPPCSGELGGLWAAPLFSAKALGMQRA
jgi:hypothetical protein